MVKKIEHIGIAVESIEDSLKIYETLLGSECYKTEVVDSEHVRTAFIRVGESKIELLEATNLSSPIAKFLSKRKEGFHHIAFEVEDIEAEINRLMANGFNLIQELPKPGADNKRIVFLHPKSTKGVLVELCQEIIS